MTTHATTRRGFTAIELLIVVAIVSLLAALTTGAVFRVMRTQEAAASDASLGRLGDALERHWKAAADAAKAEYDALPADVKQGLLLLGDNPNPPSNPRRDDRARLLYLKFRLKREFPTSFFDAIDPAPVTAINGQPVRFLPSQTYPNLKFLPRSYLFTGRPEYVRFVDEFLAATTTGAPTTQQQMRTLLAGLPSPVYQSSILLTLALEQPRGGFARTPVEEIAGSTFVAATAEDEVLKRAAPPRLVRLPRHVIDIWGNPLQFYPFPAYSFSGANGQSTTDLDTVFTINPNQTFQAALKSQIADPQDPEGLMVPPVPGQPFSGWSPALTQALPHPLVVPMPIAPRQYRMRQMQPVIASAGPDGQISTTVAGNQGWAAVDPTMSLPGPEAFDNHYSFRLRQTGARGD